MAKTLREISFVHDTLGDLPRALDYQFRALEIDERTGDPSGRATTLRMIGIVHSKSGDPATGLDFYRKSLALCTRPDDAIERGKTLNNIGINLKALGRYVEARTALREAHDVFVALGLPLQQSATLNNLGLVQECLGDVVGAERTLRDALDMSEATGYRYGVAHASLSLGKLCIAQGRHDEARRWLDDALDTCERHRLKPTQYECHEALSDLHRITGDPATALAHYQRFHALEREVLTEAASNKLRAAQIQYELAAAKREADLERARQEALTRANAELEALNISLTEANLQKTMLLDQLERQTYEDALTGLANRRRLDQRLADEFALALRHGRPLDGGHRRHRSLQDGQRPLLACGGRRRAARTGQAADVTGAAHRSRRPLRRRGIRARTGGNRRGGRAARVREAAPGRGQSHVVGDPPGTRADAVDRRVRRHDAAGP